MGFTQAPSMPYYTKIGQIEMFSGSTPPSKWKLCDGSVINRDTFADLFSVLGTAFGGGDGENTFAIPDFKGRAPVGVGESAATGHTAHTLGQYDGEEKHVLTTAELASHRHAVAVGSWDGSHSGLITIQSSTMSWNSWNGSTGNIGATGSNTAHNTMQPYTGINFIIYTGVEEEAS